MEKTINVKEQLFTDIEIRAALDKLQIQPTENCIQRMKYGEDSDLFKNIKLSDTLYKDGKIKLSKNENGDIQVNFNFVKQDLVIPPKILNHELTEDERKRLSKGDAIKLPNKDLFLKIDKDTNSITVSTGKEIGIPKEIGKYKLNDQDKELLANGKPMPPKVLEGPKGYFLANVSISPDQKGLTFSNIKSIDKEEALELMAKLNKEVVLDKDAKLAQNVTTTMADAVDPQKGIDKNEKLADNAATTLNNALPSDKNLGLEQENLKKELFQSIKDGDYLKVQALNEKGNGINDAILNDLAKAKDIPFDDKVTALSVMNKEPKDYLKELDSKNIGLDQKKGPEIKLSNNNNKLNSL